MALLGLLLLAAAMQAGCSRGMPSDPLPRMQAASALRVKGTGGKSAAAAVVSTSTGWGTLKGVFKLAGGPPAAAYLSATKDTEVCGAQLPNESLIVDGSTKGIANIVIFPRKVSRIFKSDKPAAGPEPVFDQKKCLFLSHVFAVQTKQKFLIKNSDPIGHNTNLSPPGNQAINPLLPAGGEVTFEFTKPLIAPCEVTCSIHPWMKAYILARDNPYFAITAKDGAFEIANLPAGEDIEFAVWHELAPGKLVAGPVSKGRFTLKLTADKTEDLKTIEVPASAFQ
jgi:hypothetical protein